MSIDWFQKRGGRDDSVHEGAPRKTSGDAVGGQAADPLKRHDRVCGHGAEDAVQSSGAVAQAVERVLQDQHLGADAAETDDGVAPRGAGRGPGPLVKVHPGKPEKRMCLGSRIFRC